MLGAGSIEHRELIFTTLFQNRQLFSHPGLDHAVCRSLKQSRRYDFRARAEGRCRRWLKGVEPYLPQLHCLRPRWNSATASSNACAARTVVMSGVEKLIGEVADL
jgi:hypothetical protein